MPNVLYKEKSKELKMTKICIRLSYEEKEILLNKTKEFNFINLSEYLRYLGKNCVSVTPKFE